MPITPLHFGLLAPINHFAKHKVSNASFVLVNLWLDLPSIIYVVLEIGDYSHENHTLINALIIALVCSGLRIGNKAWVLGAFLGTFSHVLMDSLVHVDVNLFYPYEGNPFYLGLMVPMSLILLPFTFWWVAQCMSGIRAKCSTH